MRTLDETIEIVRLAFENKLFLNTNYKAYGQAFETLTKDGEKMPSIVVNGYVDNSQQLLPSNSYSSSFFVVKDNINPTSANIGASLFNTDVKLYFSLNINNLINPIPSTRQLAIETILKDIIKIINSKGVGIDDIEQHGSAYSDYSGLVDASMLVHPQYLVRFDLKIKHYLY